MIRKFSLLSLMLLFNINVLGQLYFSETFNTYNDFEDFKTINMLRERWTFFHVENQDFNNNRFIDNWENIKSIDFQEIEEGNQAIRFRLKKMNRNILENDVMKNGQIDGEQVDYLNFFTHIARNEIATWDDPNLTAYKINKKYEFEFDVMVSEDFHFESKNCENPSAANYDITGQWMASYNFGVSAGSRFPILSLRIICNKWVLNQNPNNDEESQIYFPIPGEVIPGKWVKWKFEIKFSPKNKGFVYLWKDGKLVYSQKKMKTIFTDKNPKGGKGTLYFKLGVYKPHWWSRDSDVWSRTIYFDNVRVKR